MLLGAGAAPAFSPDDSNLLKIARAAVVSEVRGAQPSATFEQTPPKPVFVTIERNGKVIGCRGSLVPHSRSLEKEVAEAAKAAAAHDPRYPPLSLADLSSFLVTVTIVDRLEPISDVGSLRPDDGLVLKLGSRTGVVLPWEGKDPAIRLQWAYRKAGVPTGSAITLQRMVARRFRG